MGCDLSLDHCLSILCYFNPRTHVGCDASSVAIGSTIGISIHAPTWGATKPDDLSQAIGKFQSTHPRGVRQNDRTTLGNYKVFQSTHPRGVRPSQSYSSCVILLFQSTHPRGVRRHIHHPDTSGREFQSTHPRGVRQRPLPRLLLFYFISIHAPTWGATRGLGFNFGRTRFQSTHPRGVRPPSTTSVARSSTFQSTHPRGVRHEYP